MKTTIIACETIKAELSEAINKTGVDYPIEWLPSGLHASPPDLRAQVQTLLNELDTERVLLGMAFCGNSLVGVRAGNHQLVVPRADDCISLLVGSVKERLAITAEYASFFMTDGWLRGEKSFVSDYQEMVDTYGKEAADDIATALFGHYRTIVLLDTGVAPIEPLVESTKDMADTFGLAQKIMPATLDYLMALLVGPWDSERFLVKEAHEEITDAEALIS